MYWTDNETVFPEDGSFTSLLQLQVSDKETSKFVSIKPQFQTDFSKPFLLNNSRIWKYICTTVSEIDVND